MQPLEAADVDLSNFSPVLVEYGPKDIHAQAAKVTEDNIGQFALEFELDVNYPFPNRTGLPYMTFLATRAHEEPIELTVSTNEWVVLIWGEIHIFRDDLFKKTFEIPNIENEVELERPEAKHIIGDPVIPRGDVPSAKFRTLTKEERGKMIDAANKYFKNFGKSLVVSPNSVPIELAAPDKAEDTTIMPAVGDVENPYDVEGNPIGGTGIEDAGNDRPQSL